MLPLADLHILHICIRAVRYTALETDTVARPHAKPYKCMHTTKFEKGVEARRVCVQSLHTSCCITWCVCYLGHNKKNGVAGTVEHVDIHAKNCIMCMCSCIHVDRIFPDTGRAGGVCCCHSPTPTQPVDNESSVSQRCSYPPPPQVGHMIHVAPDSPQPYPPAVAPAAHHTGAFNWRPHATCSSERHRRMRTLGIFARA